MFSVRSRQGIFAVLLLSGAFGVVPAKAQQAGTNTGTNTSIGVDESRAIIPRAKIIRVPSAETQSTSGTASDTDVVSETDSTFELLEIEPIAGSSSGGGVIPVDDRLAVQSDATVTEDGLIAGTPAAPEGTPRVRVISPTGAADPNTENQPQDGAEVQQAALTPAEESGPRWQRNRTRRFKQAPKATETIDTSRTSAFAVPITPIRTRIKTGARLRQLDKMTGQTITFDLENGESRRVDRLKISLEACRSPKNNASHGAMAFLKIWDTRKIDGDPQFTGWMFAESPALSALDHPRYDLWVINCTTSEAEVSTVNE